MTQNNLALLYDELGKYEEAKELFEEALKTYKELANQNKAFLADVAMTQNNLANLYEKLGKNKEAKELFEEAFYIYKSLKMYEELYKTTTYLLNIYFKEKEFHTFIKENLCYYFDMKEFFKDESLVLLFIKENSYDSKVKSSLLELKKEFTPHCQRELEKFLKLLDSFIDDV